MNEWIFGQVCRLVGVAKETVNPLTPNTAMHGEDGARRPPHADRAASLAGGGSETNGRRQPRASQFGHLVRQLGG